MTARALSPGESYARIFAALLCLLPLVAIIMPRALTVMPVLVALAGLFIYRVKMSRWPALSKPAFICMGALIGLMAISTLWSIEPSVSLERTLKTAPVLLGGALLFSLARLETGLYFLRWFPFAVLAACLVCAVELYAGAPFYHLVHDPLAHDKNNLFYLNRSTALSVLMIPAALTCLHGSLPDAKKRIALYGLFALLAAALLYKTDSQSAQLSFIIGAAFYFLFPARYKAAWIVLMAVLAAGIFAAPWLAQKMFHILPAYADNQFVRSGFGLVRVEIWDFIARRALERPLFGHGIEATRVIKDFDTAMLYHPTREILHPHNFALQLWIELGILGPIYAAIFFAALLNGIRKLPPLPARTALAVLFAAVSVASTGYGLWQAMWLGAFAMLAAFCVLVARGEKTGQ